MVQLGDTRIKIIIDDYFDHTLKDWAEELRDDVRRALDNGRWEPYTIMVQRAIPGSWETVDSLSESLHTSGLTGTYATLESIPDAQLRDTVAEMLRDLPAA